MICLLSACTVYDVDSLTSTEVESHVEIEIPDAETKVSSNGFEEKLSADLSELLLEINKEHQNVVTFNDNYDGHVNRNSEEGFYFSKYEYIPDSLANNDTVLTLEQVEEDIEIYYKGLRTHYGAYEYFGGDEAFNNAFDNIREECKQATNLTTGFLKDSLLKNLSFVKDAHFFINGEQYNTYKIPFFFRQVKFFADGNKFITEDGKIVEGVKDYQKWDNLFKRSLDSDGNIVYYPVILQEVDYDSMRKDEIKCNTTLVIKYTDGTSCSLEADMYQMDRKVTEQEYVSSSEIDGIPIIKAHYFDYSTGGSRFLQTANTYRDSEIIVVDLRKNPGGEADIVKTWFKQYLQQTVSTNANHLFRGSNYFSHGEDFIEKNSILVILVSKYTSSASECFVDMAKNLENTIIIGENTLGAGRSGDGIMTLPNSGLFMRFGEVLVLHSDSENFEEYQGYLPDIWCPASEAEEAAINFIKKNIQLSE